MSPEKLALCGALGVTLGIFPVYGTTTFLCVIAAFVFRLNQAAIQVVNYAAYPLWFIMIVPFFKMGERLFSAPPIPFSAPGEIILMFKSDGFHAFQGWAPHFSMQRPHGSSFPLLSGGLYIWYFCGF